MTAHRTEFGPALGVLQQARQVAVQAMITTPGEAAANDAALTALRAALDAVLQQGPAVVLTKLGQR